MPSGSTPPGNGPLGQSRRSGHEAAATASGSGSKGSGSSSSSESESFADFLSDESSSSESTVAAVSGASRLSAASRSFASAHSRLRRSRHHLSVSAGSRQTASPSSTGKRSSSTGRPAVAPPRRTYQASCASSKDAVTPSWLSRASSIVFAPSASPMIRSASLRDTISGATHGWRPATGSKKSSRSTSIASAGDVS